MNDIQRAIETQKSICDALDRSLISSDSAGLVYIPVDRMDDIKTAISAMQELQQYHKTGMTPGEVIKMQYGYAVKMVELEEYERIGTLEECREAMEKRKKEKPRASDRCYVCPHCGLATSLKIKHNYCDACGQRIDWREEENDERLTRIKLGPEGMVMCKHNVGECNDNCMYGYCKWDKKAQKRLWEYENTNLTPDQIGELDKLYMAKCEEVNQLKAELAAERQKHRWIPVEKGKEPPADGGYLCTLNGELCGQEEPFTGMCWIENGVWDEPGMVIAYQEVPEPYQPEKGGAE